MGRRCNRRNRHRLFLPLMPSLDLYPGMPWLLYHYAMALWHHRRGARYQAQRLSKGCSVEKNVLCNLSLCWVTLGVVEVIRMGVLHVVSNHTFPL